MTGFLAALDIGFADHVDAKRRKNRAARVGQMTAAEFEAWKDEQLRNAEIAHSADMLRRAMGANGKAKPKKGTDNEQPAE